MNLKEVTGGRKKKIVTAMEMVRMGMAKMQLYYILTAVYCCGVTSVSTSAFMYFQCNGDQKLSSFLLQTMHHG